MRIQILRGIRRLILKIIYLIVIFVLLYTIAFVSNRNYRNSEDILFISKSQWKGIFLLMLPTMIVVFMR